MLTLSMLYPTTTNVPKGGLVHKESYPPGRYRYYEDGMNAIVQVTESGDHPQRPDTLLVKCIILEIASHSPHWPMHMAVGGNLELTKSYEHPMMFGWSLEPTA